MGLDMYLSASFPAPVGSVLHKVVEENLTDEHRQMLDDPDWGSAAYVSGWAFGDRKPEALFTALEAALVITCAGSAPSIDVKRDGDGGYVVEPKVYYWRKANAVHDWFVRTVQDGEDEGQESDPMDADLLTDLIHRCEAVVADHSKAQELLPTAGGFFFGSTEYDEWYFKGLAETAKDLRSVIEEVGKAAHKATHFTYRASW